MKTISKFILRFLLGVIALVLLLLMMLSLVLFVPKVQEYVSHKASRYASQKTGTKVELQAMYLKFPNGLSLQNLYVEDEAADTLLYTGNLAISIDYFALLHSELEVSKVLLENTTANVEVRQDSSFNFDFIIAAFSGESEIPETAKDTTSGSMTFDIGTIELNNIRFSYRSDPDGILTSYTIGKLSVDVEEFDLENQNYIADNLYLDKTKGRFEIFKSVPSATDADTSTSQLTVAAKNINISKTDFQFIDRSSETSFSTTVGMLELKSDPIDLSKQKINVNQLFIENTSVDVGINSALENDSIVKDSIAVESETSDEIPWQMAMEELQLKNFNFSFNDAGESRIQKGVDYAHLDLAIEELASNKLYFNGINDLGLQLNKLSAKDQSGLSIKQAAFELKMDANSIATKNLILKTPKTAIVASAIMKFKSLAEIGENIGKLEIDLQFDQTIVGLSDLLYFAPDLDTIPMMAKYLNQQLNIDGKVSGAVNQMNINNLDLSLKNATALSIDGQLNGLPNMKDLSFDIQQLLLETNREDLTNLLPDSSIPPNIQLPQSIQLNLTAEGSIEDLAAQLNMKSTYGDLIADLEFSRPDTNTSAYHLQLELAKFDLASLVQDSSLGNLGFKGNIQGKGLSLSEMELQLDAVVQDFEYLNYQYSDLNINGLLEEESFEGTVNMKDSNLIFDFNGKADLDSTKPSFDFVFNLEGIDLQRLNITEEDYRANGSITADFSGNSLENLNGDLDIRDILIIHKGKQYHVDSLLLVSIIDSGKTDITIHSNLMDAMFKGNIYLTDLDEALQNHFNNRLVKGSDNSSPSSHQDFKFNIKIHDPALLTEVLLTDLNSFETGEINGAFDTKDNTLKMQADFPKIDYSNLIIDSLMITAKTDSNKLTANIGIKRFSYDTLGISNISLQSSIQKDKGTFTLRVLNELKEKMLQLNADLSQKDSALKLHFTADNQYIGGEIWQVDPQNNIAFNTGIDFNQLIFTNDQQSIELQSNKSIHDLKFTNFKLSTITKLISHSTEKKNQATTSFEKYQQSKAEHLKDSSSTPKPLLTGLLNGDVQFPADTTAKLKADVNVDKLQITQVPIGNIKSKYSQGKRDDSVQLILNGEGNKMKVEGFISDNETNITADIQRLKMSVVEAFSDGQLTNSKGYISANANFSKTKEDIDLKGELVFNEVRLRSTYLGETYFLNQSAFQFSENHIKFNEFTILDSSKHSFVTNGSIDISSLDEPKADLNVTVDHFRFLNTTKEDANDLFYGKVLASANLDVQGKLKKPEITVKLELEKGTDITFVVPNEEADEIDREGVVRFVDKKNKLPELLSRNKTSDSLRLDFMGMDLTSLIRIDKQTKLTIVIDPQTGDRLKIQGGGEIRADVDPSGRINMDGIYTIEDGNYELKLYNLVQRRFNLKKGSQLVWNGEPLEAKMDIQGVYTAKAAPLGLLGNQISNMSEEEKNKYKKRIPFKVLLLLGGEIMKPDISFRIELPEDQKANLEGAVATKLNQLNQSESELNRQVFSLIILKRFYSNSPTNAGNGGSYAAWESVSQILTQQLNRLSDKYVKGVNVELSVDSYNDYTAGGEAEGNTDVNLAISKSLFNDRVEVRLDGDFNVENNNQTSSSSGIAGDVSIEYKITKDGKYKLKLFRKDEYEGIIEGEFIETGVSLIYTKEFLKFNELFRKKTKKDQ